MKILQKSKEELKYIRTQWGLILQIVSVVFFFVIVVALGTRLVLARRFFTLVSFVFTFVFAQLSSDFVSGLVHWSFDTWGSNTTPVVGSFIRAFREHHVDQSEITHHSFFVTSASAGILVFPVQIGTFFLPIESEISYIAVTFLSLLTFLSFCTNLFHKWAHEDNPSFFVRFLQKSRLVLEDAHHQKHHTEPFNKSYCITNGWMNPILGSIKFFPFCERIITKYTGAIPRVDDIGHEAAHALAKQEGVI